MLNSAEPSAWAAPVPACPGWDVKAVVSHLVGVIEDVMAGRLSGLPDATATAEQVARHAADEQSALLATWARVAPLFERVVTRNAVWEAMLDGLSHEHDIRGALGVPGDRLGNIIELAARWLVDHLEVPVAFDTGEELLVPAGVDAPTHHVQASPFETFRLRLGRRSREQVLELRWVPRPTTAVVDALFVFGPRDTPLVE